MLSMAETNVMTGLDILTLFLSSVFYIGVFVFGFVTLENNKRIVGQLAFFALLAQVAVLVADLNPDLRICQVLANLCVSWNVYNISLADSEFARLLSPISSKLKQPFFNVYRWLLWLSILVTTGAYILVLINQLSQFTPLDWLNAVKMANLESAIYPPVKSTNPRVRYTPCDVLCWSLKPLRY